MACQVVAASYFAHLSLDSRSVFEVLRYATITVTLLPLTTNLAPGTY